jgi:CheY-like chemotaxis protein
MTMDNTVNPQKEQEDHMAQKVLVIDDEQMILTTVKVILEDMGYPVTATNDFSEGEREAATGSYALILCDLRMPEKNGAQVTRSIMASCPDARILIITAFPGDPLAAEAIEAGAIGLLRKPFEIAKILDALGPEES